MTLHPTQFRYLINEMLHEPVQVNTKASDRLFVLFLVEQSQRLLDMILIQRLEFFEFSDIKAATILVIVNDPGRISPRNKGEAV